MRRIVAALALTLLALLHVIDPVLCADGCTSDAQGTQTAVMSVQEDPGACLLCQCALIAGPDAPLRRPVLVHAVKTEHSPSFVNSQPQPRIDRPPRLS